MGRIGDPEASTFRGEEVLGLFSGSIQDEYPRRRPAVCPTVYQPIYASA